MTEKQDPLRIAAAIFLGIITGGIIFLVIAMGIGILNDMAHMNVSVSMDIFENVFSAALLVLVLGVCITFFYWKVATTPPLTPEQEEGPEGGD